MITTALAATASMNPLILKGKGQWLAYWIVDDVNTRFDANPLMQAVAAVDDIMQGAMMVRMTVKQGQEGLFIRDIANAS